MPMIVTRSFSSVRLRCAASPTGPPRAPPLITMPESLKQCAAHRLNVALDAHPFGMVGRLAGRIKDARKLVVIGPDLAEFREQLDQRCMIGGRIAPCAW